MNRKPDPNRNPDLNKKRDGHDIPESITDIKSMYPDELAGFVKGRGLPAFRARQLFQWIHVSRAAGYEEMSNLPAGLRRELAEEYPLVTARQVDCRVSGVDGTRKYLFAMPDGCLVESVFMRYHFGNSVCISSQVGCRMGCGFERISHVVVMGMGEPFDNYDNLIRFLRLLTCPEGMNLSQRSVTVSTCGIVPGIRRFTREGLHVTLALSLHAATDEQRRKIMPVANRWSIAELMEACGEYSRVTGRQVTFEYSLIKGVNDSRADALGLVKLAKPLRAHINLIPVNPVRERGFSHPDSEGVRAFKMELEKHGVNVSIRRALGKDIDGACGQLRNRYAEQEPGTV